MQNLPDSSLEHITSFLLLSERCRFLGTQSCFWRFKAELEQRTTTLTFRSIHSTDQEDGNDNNCAKRLFLAACPTNDDAQFFPQNMFQNFSHALQTLDMGPHGSDDFFRLIADNNQHTTNNTLLLPHLQHVGVARSLMVTDKGLAYLSQWGGISLESIDITFCHNTTYAGTFCVRDTFKRSLKVLRRQPEWLDGHFHTPFHRRDGNGHNDNQDDNQEVEIHTYYADGTFSFTRENQSRGFVMQLEEGCEGSNSDYLHDKLQYTNFQTPQGWPAWATYAYRPGVCLLKLTEEGNEGGEPIRTVLVGQHSRGLRPPNIPKLMRSHASKVAVGESKQFLRVDSNHNDNINTSNANDHEDPYFLIPFHRVVGGDNVVVISKMKVLPLDEESLMPPPDLLQECRLACEIMDGLGDDILANGEAYLQTELNA